MKTKPLASSKDLQGLMLKKLKESGLEAHAKTLGFTPMDAPPPGGSFPSKPGFLIPYWTVDGKPRKEFWRYRYLEDTRTGFERITAKKPLRYIQPAGTKSYLYMPPVVNWKERGAKDAVLVTEGELKAACACAMGIPTVGVGGVFNLANDTDMLLPEFLELGLEDRPVYIVYDSDAKHNTNVILAENRLASRLLMHKAHPYIVRLPEGPGGEKQGLDDFLVANGADALLALLEQTEEFSASSALHALNEKLVFVQHPLCVVEIENRDRKMDPGKFAAYHYGNLRHLEVQIMPSGSSKKVPRPTADAWLKWIGRREVNSVTYAPGQGNITSRGELNDWRGWGVDPEAGDVTPWNELMDFIFQHDVAAHRIWFERWLAYPLQHPGAKMLSASVFWGVEQGTGKSMIGETMKAVYGVRNTALLDNSSLEDSRNEWAVNKQFAFGDEITGGDKRGIADRLKGLITQSSIRVNIKYVPSYMIPDTINYYFTSNHPDAFYLDSGDRRFFIHEVRGPKKDLEWYETFVNWRDKEGGAAKLFHHLLTLDLGNFNPAAPPPVTDAKLNMTAIGRSDLGEWVAMLRAHPDTVLRVGDVVLKHMLWSAEELRDLYDPDGKKVTANGMGRELSRQGFRRACVGKPVRLPDGRQSILWGIRNAEKLHAMSPIQVQQAYESEREHRVGVKKKKF